MFLQLACIFILSSTCSGAEYFVTYLQNSSIDLTCYKQGHQFYPCNTLEYYSNVISNHSYINTTLYLLDNRYEMSADSHFYFEATLVDIRPWGNESEVVIISCTEHDISLYFAEVDTLHIQSVQFLQCGRSGHPVVHVAKSYENAKQVLLSNLSFVQSRNISILIQSDISELEIIRCIFTEGSNGVLVDSEIISNAIIRNSSFIYNTGKSLFFQTSSIESNLIIDGCIFMNNTIKLEYLQYIVELMLSNLTVIRSHFIKNSPNGVVFIKNTNHTIIHTCCFQYNMGPTTGSIRIASEASFNSKIQILNTIFRNQKSLYGGAVMIEKASAIYIKGSIFSENKILLLASGDSLQISGSTMATISKCLFSNSTNNAIYCSSCRAINISNCDFINNYKIGDKGGAIKIIYSNYLNIYNSHFRNNQASNGGGGVYVQANVIAVVNTTWINNTARDGGGGAMEVTGDLHITSCTFMNNKGSSGGALLIRRESTNFISLTNFSQNIAERGGGGAIALWNALLIVQSCHFIQNKAVQGNGGALEASLFTLAVNQSNFISNTAQKGGAIHIVGEDHHSDITFIARTVLIFKSDFVKNEAREGGAMLIENTTNTAIVDSYFSHNIGAGAVSMNNQNRLDVLESHFFNNSANLGGAIYFESVSEFEASMPCRHLEHKYNYTSVSIQDCLKENCDIFISYCLIKAISPNKLFNAIIKCNFSQNAAVQLSNGGAVLIKGIKRYSYQPQVPRSNICYQGGIIRESTFHENIAVSGGGIYTITSNLQVTDSTFLRNEALYDGGGIYSSQTRIYFSKSINFYNNTSKKGRGGSIFITESCIKNACPLLWANNSTLNFVDNIALVGSMIFGGMLGKCDFLPGNSLMTALDRIKASNNLHYALHSYDITSRKVRFCFCSSCDLREMNASVYPGQGYNISLACVDQLWQPLNNCLLRNEFISTVNVQLGQGENKIEISGCETVTFHVLSRQTDFVGLNISSDILCTDTMWSRLVVYFKIESCPIGFQLYNRKCCCDQRLSDVFKDVICNIDNQLIILQHSGWFSYQGSYLITHSNCPLNYCHRGVRSILPREPDSQCDYNRGGILCGGCVANYSVVLGSWKCMDCSHLSRYNFIWLTVLLALAGMVLVVFLLLVKMTVSSGTTNGLILYANILSFSGLLDYRTCSIHPVLRVFLSWINLDLGIEVCYYSGMDVYQKTWLQFVFPFYIWFLVGVIILFCHYSSRVMKLMGMRNIEVLATLFLLSYAKLLKTIVTAFSFTDIMTAKAENVSDPLLPTRVWVFDGSIEYLKDEHLPLFIIALLLLLLLFLPYTLLLTLGQYLYLLPNKSLLSTLVTTIMDAYHAPYNRKFRYWTGLCLIIRCCLFTIFSVSNTIGANMFWTLLFVIFLFSLRMLARNQIYKSRVVDILEVLILLNLAILIVTFTTDHFCSLLTVSVTFSAIMFGFILIFHVCIEIKRTDSFSKVITGIASFTKVKSEAPVIQESTTNNDGKPSTSYVELRETLIGP